MCNDCSLFLDLEDANSIINPAYEKSETQVSEEANRDRDSTDSIRLCEHCLHLLETRKEMQDSRSDRPQITKLYEKLEKTKNDAIPDLAMYEKMINSLYEGGSVYTLNDASALRGKIGHLAEIIDTVSKQILAQKCQSGSRQESLQKSIRMGSVKFIKDQMLSIPPIPTEDVIKKIQQKRINELSMKIERDRRLAQEAFEKYELGACSEIAGNSGTKTGFAMTTIDNWSGSQQVSGFNNDPLVEQINIIKSYIKQARDAMRFEEVETLEYNLRELQHEFYLRQEKSQQSPDI
jgi:rabenosyn-5